MSRGWSVVITRADGSEFFCSSGAGILPPVWLHGQRQYAVAAKRDLVAQGLKARVVSVTYNQPVVLERSNNARHG